MKKLVLILLISLALPIFLKGQSSYYLTDTQKYYSEPVYINWTQQYPIVNCMPSFTWSVTRSKNVNEYGQFFYKMYFKSNSMCNGTFRGVTINGIVLRVNGNIMNTQSKYWITFSDIYQPPILSFWANSNPILHFTWDNVIIN